MMDRQFAFGGFRFDARTGELWGDRKQANLTPRAAAVLTMLAERAPKLVSKQELFERVWGGLAVSDDALTSSIQELRHALGDDARAPRYIETRHRRGYRLIEPAAVIGEGAELPGALIAPPPGASSPAGRIAEARGLDTAPVRHHPGGSLPLPDRPSIAVLPFVNLSGHPNQEHVADGITEDLITGLSVFAGCSSSRATRRFNTRASAPTSAWLAESLASATSLKAACAVRANACASTPSSSMR